jgi:hypothetical protein
MSNLGLLSYYLGSEVRHEMGKITLCNKKYTEKILDAADMGACNPFHMPKGIKEKGGKAQWRQLGRRHVLPQHIINPEVLGEFSL